LKAEGYNNLEIAERTGYTAVSVSNILRQPWIVELIAEEQKKQGRTALEAVLNEEQAVECFQTLIDLRKTAESQEVQRKAANDLLNRMYGMPNQSITHTQKLNLDNLTDEELAKIVVKGRSN
jgi:hypothetical protein